MIWEILGAIVLFTPIFWLVGISISRQVSEPYRRAGIHKRQRAALDATIKRIIAEDDEAHKQPEKYTITLTDDTTLSMWMNAK